MQALGPEPGAPLGLGVSVPLFSASPPLPIAHSGAFLLVDVGTMAVGVCGCTWGAVWAV